MKVSVYCSSSDQIRTSFYDAGFRLGALLAQNGHTLVYGDGGIGLMRKTADGVLSEGGEVIGVIPRFMVEQGWNNPESTHTIVVNSMHERKQKIAEISDAFVALPGGIGTLDELCECLTWKQLGLHTKPIVILNTDGYFDPFLRCLDQMVDEHFMRDIHRDSMFSVVSEPEDVLPAIMNAPEWSKDVRKMAKL